MVMDVTLNLGDGIIRVSWDSGVPSGKIAGFFSPWRIERGNENCETVREIEITSSLRGFTISSPLLPKEFCPGERELSTALENILTVLAIDILKNNLLFHAAVLDLHGSGALIAGDHGSGKTTLALTALSSGFKVLSDEVGVVTNDCRRAVGFPRPFRVLPDTLKFRPSIVPSNCPSVRISNELTYVFLITIMQQKPI